MRVFTWYLDVRKIITKLRKGANRAGAGVSHLAGQEVRETLRLKSVDVVDGISLPSQRVDEHPGPGSDGGLSNLWYIIINYLLSTYVLRPSFVFLSAELEIISHVLLDLFGFGCNYGKGK